MPLISKSRQAMLAIPCLAVLVVVSMADAAMDPRFEIDPQALADSVPPPKAPKKEVRSAKARSERTSPATNATCYIVKPGDHLFKILMRDYGMSNNEAELFIEEIKAENNIRDIKRLKVGQKITIPAVRRRTGGSHKQIHSLQAASPGPDRVEVPSRQSFVLESPVTQPSSGQDGLEQVRGVWNKVVPAKADLLAPLVLQTPTFSLTLDPQRFPTFSTMDGARILVDQNGSIPSLVKLLIEEKDPTVRIVSESPASAKRFMSSMLKAAGFYSVEENFSLDFGTDPKLTVHADFKVEKTAESLIKQDVVLMSSGRVAVPPVLGEFLKKEGFSLYEPFASLKKFTGRDARPLHIVAAKNLPEMVDSILSAFSVAPDRDRSLDVFAAENNGISLAVKAERYFEHGGKRYVITRFDGDPVNYTLFRILETKGYRVVILEEKDDFRKVSEKIISSMKIPGHFSKHNLLQDDSGRYSLQMSGFKLDDSSLPGGGLFLTDRAMDRIIRDLLTENGYSIHGR